MLYERALRVTSVLVLAGLAALVGVGSQHDSPRQVQAGTTWVAPVGSSSTGATHRAQPADTTW